VFEQKLAMLVFWFSVVSSAVISPRPLLLTLVYLFVLQATPLPPTF
jgi:hypothetical protein